MRISLFGIGYVGSVAAACLARDGHTVVAVDINPDKVAALNQGRAPITEPGLDALILAGVRSGRLTAITAIEEAVAATDLSLICVGTPSAPDGSLDMASVVRVAEDIGRAIARKPGFHVVAVRSTLEPGSMTGRIGPATEAASGLAMGRGFGLAYYPEFLREGSAIRDYDDPPQTLFAASDPLTQAQLCTLAPAGVTLIPCDWGVAEAVKLVRNARRGVTVSFANEVGAMLTALGVDSHQVMQSIEAEDRRARSPAYLTPGFAFGGSCLPKDLRAMQALGARTGSSARTIEAALGVNQAVIDRAASLVTATGKRRVSLIGVAFKPGTDDLRESPYLMLAERLVSERLEVRIFDPCIQTSALIGANLAYANVHLPGIATRLCDTLEAAVVHGEVLVLAHPGIGGAALALSDPSQRIVDLVRVRPDLRSGGNYLGLSW